MAALPLALEGHCLPVTAPRSTVAILGAGPAGMAAAFHLSRRGYAVTILEERTRLGGGLVAEDDQGHLLDALPPVIFGHHHATLSLLKTLGTTKMAHLTAPRAIEFRHHGRGSTRLRSLWLPAPLHSILGLAASRGLTVRDLWRALTFLQQSWEENPALPLDLDSRRADQWLTDIRQSEDAQVNVWAPLARFLLNSELSGVSAGLLVDVLRRSFLTARADSRIGIADRSWHNLLIAPLDAQFEQLGVARRTGVTFDHVQVKHQRVVGLRLADRHTVTADWYVSAVPPRRLSALLPEQIITHYATFHQLAKLSDAPGLTVQLWIQAALTTPRLLLLVGHTFHWLVVRPAEHESHLAKDGAAAKPSKDTIVVSLVATGRADLMHHPDRALADFALTDVRTAIPELAQATVLKHHVIKRERACLVARPGTTALRPLSESPISNLVLAGGWTDTGLPDSIESALVSAERCVEVVSKKKG